MSKRLLEIYALAVCFVSVGCLSIVSGLLIYTLIEIAFPSMIVPPPIPPPIIEYHQSGTNIVPAVPVPSEPTASIGAESTAQNNKAFLKRQKQFQLLEIERMKKESISSVVRNTVILFIAAIVFWIHWRIAK